MMILLALNICFLSSFSFKYSDCIFSLFNIEYYIDALFPILHNKTNIKSCIKVTINQIYFKEILAIMMLSRKLGKFMHSKTLRLLKFSRFRELIR